MSMDAVPSSARQVTDMTQTPRLLHPSRPLFRGKRRLAAVLAAVIGVAAGPAGAATSPFDYQKVGATVSYSIEITGQANTGNASDKEWSKADVTRHLQGTLHLAGQQTQVDHLDNAEAVMAHAAPAQQALAADMPTIQRISEECGDDDACMTTRMTTLVNGMSADKRQVLVSAANGPAAKTSRHESGVWTLDGHTSCSIQATSRGTSSYRIVDVGEGYAESLTGSETRQGQGHDDCRHDPLPEARAEWNGDTRLLDLTLPGLTLSEQWSSADGKSGSRQIAMPDVVLEHLHWSGKGPQTGQQVRHISTGAGDHSVPATMTIRWTFAPNRS